MLSDYDNLQFLNYNESEEAKCFYQGNPYPTIEALGIIGENGVIKIQNHIKKVIQSKKKGTGLPLCLQFADYTSRRIVEVTGEWKGNPDGIIKSHRGLSDFVIPNQLKENNFKLLKETDFFLIEMSRLHTHKEFIAHIVRNSGILWLFFFAIVLQLICNK